MIIAAMATIPERLRLLEKAVSSLRPQVDLIRVYLNNFTSVPPFLSSSEGVLSTNAVGDIGDAGKFYWFDKENYDSYLTVDDDMAYPKDYVAKLVHEFEIRHKKAIIGVHGFTFSPPIKSYVTSRDKRYKGTRALNSPQPVHVIGTATAILSRQTISLSLKDFPARNMADLQLAIAAQKQKVPMVVIPREENWLGELQSSLPLWGYSIWKETKLKNGQAQAELANSKIQEWQLFPDPK